jgi:hypothetical protein
MPLRDLPQPIRFIQQRPFRAQDLRAFAHHFRLTVNLSQFAIQYGDGMFHLVQIKPRTGCHDQADKGKRADHAARLVTMR